MKIATKMHKTIKSIILTLVSVCLCAVSPGLTADRAYADEPQVITFDQMNDWAGAYMNEVTYPDPYGSTTCISQYVDAAQGNGDKPAQYFYYLDTSGGTKLCVENLDDTSEPVRTISCGGSEYCLISNLIPGCKYECRLLGGSDETIETKIIQVEGQLRMIWLDGTRNFRDLGGWQADGGRIRYGKIIRGAATNSTDGSLNITEEDKQTLKQIGIDEDFDLRSTGEMPGTPGTDIPDAGYVNIPISNYAESINPAYGGIGPMSRLLKEIITAVNSGETVYVHCVYGADRTGTVCFMLEGLLGVSQSDLDKDFELTSFYKSRYRDGSDGSTYNKYPQMVAYIESYRGDSLQEKFINWYHDRGITYKEMNDFRKAMIDGEPETIVDPDAPVDPDDPEDPDPHDDPVDPTPVKASISNAAVSGLPASLVYDGSYRKPSFTLKVNGKVLSAGTDYKVSWTSNKNVGRAEITVQGTGAYEGTKKLSFKIVPRKPSSVKGKKKTAKKVQVSWKKRPEAGGYQIRYAFNKKMKKARKLSSAKTRRIFKPAGKAKRTVYVQVRTLKKTAAGTYYSAWSKVIRIKR